MWRDQAEIKWAWRRIFIVAWCHSVKLCTFAARSFQSQQSGALTRMWRWCQVQPSQKERAMGALHCKNEEMLLQPLGWCCIKSVVFSCSTHENHQRWTCTVLGFKSCDISIYWWIWMLPFLLKQIQIGIDGFLLDFFATLGSVSPLQVNAGRLQFNTGSHPPTRWEPFVAGAMLCRPETTKKRVEPTILRI